jgi:signal transduction histidine kinase/DNA-binding response OmpR family regulator/HAMP domain-containing protein
MGMRLTFRTKLLAIVAVNALALVVLIATSTLIEREVDHQLARIQREYVPRIGLQPRLEGAFARIGRTFQDAVAAADEDLLVDARDQVDALLAQIRGAGAVIPPEAARELIVAIETYAAAGTDVSRRMIAGANDESLVAAMERMQRLQADAAERIGRVTAFDAADLGARFAAAAETQRTGARIRLVISGICLISILGLSMWIGRGLVRALASLAAGFRRFGDGDLATPIPVTSRDELGDVATQANQMAQHLERSAWLKSGQGGLVAQLHGDLEPEQVARRAIAFLARHFGAPAGAIYYTGRDGAFELLGAYGIDRPAGAQPPRFHRGEGVIGEAALRDEPTILDAPEERELRLRGGLVEVRPRTLVLVPLLHVGQVTGVVELALLDRWPEGGTELMRSVREVLTIAIEVARARGASRALLAETQRQAAELLEARGRLEQKADELARASAYKSQFLANMSHELRTPLNAIIGFSELMHEEAIPDDPAQRREFLGHILVSGRHLLALINDILDLSKVEAGKLEFRPEALRLSRLVDEVVGILRTTASAKQIRLEPAIDPEVEELTLDPGRLKQVLYNYVSNAIKFTPAGGRIAIRATPEGADEVRFEVEDTGIGIAPDDLGRLFADFQQLANKHISGGTGLGLALTKRLVEAQGGRVGVRSTLGTGSVFHAILPRVATTGFAEPTPSPVEPAKRGAPRVLVVEDDPVDGRQLADALKHAGYGVEVCTSGAQAIARASEHPFDAITLDLLLPDMSGLDVVRQLRNGKSQRAPVIVVTVVAEPGVLAGFAVRDVLLKPVDGDALAGALRRAGVSATTSRQVVVVDDDAAALRLMSTHLEQLGYDPAGFDDARAALAAVRAKMPAAIILDLMMPGMSGFEFLDQLRSEGDGRSVPVIVWTSKDLDPGEHAMLRASAVAVVSKGHGGSSGVVAELVAQLPPRG